MHTQLWDWDDSFPENLGACQVMITFDLFSAGLYQTINPWERSQRTQFI